MPLLQVHGDMTMREELVGYLTSASRDVKDAPVVPAAVLHGHTSAITCCDVSAELDVAITGAADGMVLVHSVSEAQYVRELRRRMVSVRCQSTAARLRVGL